MVNLKMDKLKIAYIKSDSAYNDFQANAPKDIDIFVLFETITDEGQKIKKLKRDLPKLDGYKLRTNVNVHVLIKDILLYEDIPSAEKLAKIVGMMVDLSYGTESFNVMAINCATAAEHTEQINYLLDVFQNRRTKLIPAFRELFSIGPKKIKLLETLKTKSDSEEIEKLYNALCRYGFIKHNIISDNNNEHCEKPAIKVLTCHLQIEVIKHMQKSFQVYDFKKMNKEIVKLCEKYIDIEIDYDAFITEFRDIYRVCLKEKTDDNLMNSTSLKELNKKWENDELTLYNYMMSVKPMYENFGNAKDYKKYFEDKHHEQKLIKFIEENEMGEDLLVETMKLSGNYQEDAIKQIANGFAKSFEKNIDKILHKCDIKFTTYVNHPRKIEVSSQVLDSIMTVTVAEIKDILENLKPQYKPGNDGIRPIDVQKNAKQLAELMTNFINEILDDPTKIPTSFQEAIVLPIYKAGDPKNMDNYRPISILPAFEKVMEEVIRQRLNKHLEDYAIMHKRQFAYLDNRTGKQLLEKFISLINNQLHQKHHTLVLFIDLSKAFDTVPHDKLLEVLRNIGVDGKFWAFFDNYLKDRRFRVGIKNEVSDLMDIKLGVPQGSKLGPTLFITYTNNLLNTLEQHDNNSTVVSDFFAYADDIAIVKSAKRLEDAIEATQASLNTMRDWCHDNGLIINSKKTKIMHIRSKDLPDQNASIDIKYKQHCTKVETPIQVVNVQRYLGYQLDEHFEWQEHFNVLQTKLDEASRKMLILNFLGVNLKNYYKGRVLPKLNLFDIVPTNNDYYKKFIARKQKLEDKYNVMTASEETKDDNNNNEKKNGEKLQCAKNKNNKNKNTKNKNKENKKTN